MLGSTTSKMTVRTSKPKTARLNDVARDQALTLSDDVRTAHEASTCAALTSTKFYPFQPQGEGMVNLSNATKILLNTRAAVMRQSFSAEHLCRFEVDQQQSMVLQSVCYPTPECWIPVVKNENMWN